MSARQVLSGAFAAWLLLGSATAAEINVISVPIPLDTSDPARVTLGPLQYRGGLRLYSNDVKFGGFSGLRVSADGTQLLAVNDRANWLAATLRYDAAGNLAGIDAADLRPIRDSIGRPLLPPRSDAESLVRLPDAILVGYERTHRIVRYLIDAAGQPLDAGPQVLPVPRALTDGPMNGGLEAMTVLKDGRILAIAEDIHQGEPVLAWLLGGAGGDEALLYLPARGFLPTDATTLPNGDVLVLERQFTFLARAGRIVRIPADAIKAGATLSGTEIARLTPPVQTDNFEGIDAIADGTGVRIFVLSDDNYLVLQRTLLLQFWMPL